MTSVTGTCTCERLNPTGEKRLRDDAVFAAVSLQAVLANIRCLCLSSSKTVSLKCRTMQRVEWYNNYVQDRMRSCYVI